MSCAMTRTEAERLYTILDEKLGFFRVENMSERALEFHNEKRDELIEYFTNSIPEEYWFQGINTPSANLTFNSIDGLRVVCVNNDSKTQEYFDTEVNPLLKQLEHTSIIVVD